MNIKLHIDRLVLEGINLDPAQRLILQATMEAELGRLLSEGGVGALAAGGAVPSVKAEGFQMSGEGNPAQLGAQIARSIYGGIRK